MYTPEQMYRLVDNIAVYPEFLPWCSHSEEYQRQENQVEARIDVNSSGFKQSFSTRNQLEPFSSIEMKLLEGPFKLLTGIWSFDPVGDPNSPQGCKIALHMEFEFSNKLLGLTFGKIFGTMASSMVDAFIERANKLYDGKK